MPTSSLSKTSNALVPEAKRFPDLLHGSRRNGSDDFVIQVHSESAQAPVPFHIFRVGGKGRAAQTAASGFTTGLAPASKERRTSLAAVPLHFVNESTITPNTTLRFSTSTLSQASEPFCGK